MASTMQGLWLEGGELRLRRDIPVSQPPEGEALVRVVRAGICNTDLELVRGYYPFTGILGHEFVGVVEEGPEAEDPGAPDAAGFHFLAELHDEGLDVPRVEDGGDTGVEQGVEVGRPPYPPLRGQCSASTKQLTGTREAGPRRRSGGPTG